MFGKNKKCKCGLIWLHSLICALLVSGYVVGVGYLLMNGDKIFGNQPALLGVAAILLLFVVSAFITSLLMIGGPIHLYLLKEKKKAVIMLFLNLMWLIIITVVAIMVRIVI